MENNLENDSDAVQYLREDTSLECAEKLVEYYWQFREEGLDLDNAVDRAQLHHGYHDHGEEERFVDFELKTDEEVETLIITSLKEQQESPSYLRKDIPLDEKIEVILSYYRTYRGWGFNIGFSLFFASKTAEFVMRDRYPASEEYAFELLAKCPQSALRDFVIDAFRDMRNHGMSVDEALAKTLQAGKIAGALQNVLGPVQYGAPDDDIDNGSHPLIN